MIGRYLLRKLSATKLGRKDIFEMIFIAPIAYALPESKLATSSLMEGSTTSNGARNMTGVAQG